MKRNDESLMVFECFVYMYEYSIFGIVLERKKLIEIYSEFYYDAYN